MTKDVDTDRQDFIREQSEERLRETSVHCIRLTDALDELKAPIVALWFHQDGWSPEDFCPCGGERVVARAQVGNAVSKEFVPPNDLVFKAWVSSSWDMEIIGLGRTPLEAVRALREKLDGRARAMLDRFNSALRGSR